MWEGTQPIDAAEAAALVDWWIGAGADVAVGEAPRDWLRALPPPPSVQPAPELAPQAASLEALQAELAVLPIPGLAPSARRVAPQGSAGARVMLLTDLPSAEDVEEARLFGGACGRLLDAMLAAIGLSRADVYLASVSPARPASGRLGEPARALLGPLARRHVALAAPGSVLLLGDVATSLLLDVDCAAARGRWHDVNHGEGIVRALATLHPRTLLSQPLLKAESWRDLRLLKETLG